ncbi:hypothetical protein [Flavobacterium sp.]|uniref:hypothetical protein n=1 Tax=Flavobacterium sp. TaxID=239 RepID=UPI000EBB712C|nr:hypothetical protein [Flavobacterium sp.]HCQ13632.1 hypothetical protein [Flavobacterium sp.]
MKKQIIFLLACILFTTISFSQDLNALKAEIQKTYDATIALNYDKILDYTYPKLYKFIPRDKMKEALIATFNGTDEMKVKILAVDPNFNYGEIKTIDDQKICLVKHNLSMELTLKETLEEEDVEMMIDLLKSTMETEDITFDKEKTTFKINKIATMIAISDELTNNQWRFLNKDKENKLMAMLLNKKVVKELGL